MSSHSQDSSSVSESEKNNDDAHSSSSCYGNSLSFRSPHLTDDLPSSSLDNELADKQRLSLTNSSDTCQVDLKRTRKKKHRSKGKPRPYECEDVQEQAQNDSTQTKLPINLKHRWQRKKIKSPVVRRLLLPSQDNEDAIEIGEPTAITEAEGVLLVGYIKRAKKDSERFYKAADKNRKCYKWTQLIVLIILSVTAGGSTLFNLLTPSDDGTFAYRITLNVLLVISAILQAVQQTFRFEQKSTNYEMTADDYFNYTREWAMRMAQGVDDRRDKCVDALTSARHCLREIELGALPL